MDTQTLLWILGTVIGIQVLVLAGIIGLIVHHSRDCRDNRVDQARHTGQVDAKLERIITDIGDHESGLRGALHKLRNDLSPFAVWVQMQMQRKEEDR